MLLEAKRCNLHHSAPENDDRDRETCAGWAFGASKAWQEVTRLYTGSEDHWWLLALSDQLHAWRNPTAICLTSLTPQKIWYSRFGETNPEGFASWMPHYTSGGKTTAARLQKDLGDAGSHHAETLREKQIKEKHFLPCASFTFIFASRHFWCRDPCRSATEPFGVLFAKLDCHFVFLCAPCSGAKGPIVLQLPVMASISGYSGHFWTLSIFEAVMHIVQMELACIISIHFRAPPPLPSKGLDRANSLPSCSWTSPSTGTVLRGREVLRGRKSTNGQGGETDKLVWTVMKISN